MKKNPDTPTDTAQLRRQAEAKLIERKKKAAPPPATEADTRRLVHELEVHQIELEMQNEELVRARAEVEGLLRQYTDLNDFAPTGYFTLARDGAIRQVNLAGANLLGIERGALINRHFGLFVSAEARPAFNAFLGKVFESQGKETCEVALQKDLSAPLWVHIEAITDASRGQREACCAVMVDITERKRAEESLRRHAERLRNLRETDQAIRQAVESPEAIAQTALHHLRGLLHCQRASIGIFDLKKKEVQIFAAEVSGETIVQKGKVLVEEAYGDLDILRQGRMEIVENMSEVTSPPAVARILQVEGIRSSINVPLFSAQGLLGALNIGWEDARAITPEEKEIAGDVAGQITIAIGQSRLLQEAKRHAAELELRVADRTAQLEAANKELEAFTYSVSHDLRAPLRHVSGYVDLLINRFRSALTDKGQHYLDSIADSVHNMGLLIDNLLQFSQTGRVEVRRSDSDMNGLVQEVKESICQDNPDRSIEWTAGKLPSVFCDSAMLRLVWMNLLSNAVKFTRTRGKALIGIGAKVETKEIIFFVRDNGVGFDMKYAQKLFGVFQRLHPTEDFEGTGIGLAIVRRIVSRHGGRTWAEAELDKGASFYFSIPR